MSHLVEKSEVARLRQRIRMEYEAAVRGLCGLTQGTAQHAFITRRMEHMLICSMPSLRDAWNISAYVMKR
jgi:hypothetical protein